MHKRYNSAVALLILHVLILVSGFFYADTVQASEVEARIFINGQEKFFSPAPSMIAGRVFVPMRPIFEALGATVQWNGQDKTIVGQRNGEEIWLKIDSPIARIGGKEVEIDAPPTIIKGSTMVPLRFVGEALGEKVGWKDLERVAFIGIEPKVIPPRPQSQKPFASSQSSTINLGNKIYNVKVVTVDLKDPRAGVKVVSSHNQIGLTEPLKAMAERDKAVAAINGTFFNAYIEDIKEPTGNIIMNNSFVRKGTFGTTVGFTDDNRVIFDQVTVHPTLNLMINAWESRWYVDNFNGTPSKEANAAMVFTPERGPKTRVDFGASAVVRNGVITDLVPEGDVDIPRDGFVVKFFGSYIDKYYNLLTKGVGVTSTYTYDTNTTDGADWDLVVSGLGAGPRLLTEGQVMADPQKENFSSWKILSSAQARSAIGVTKDNKLLLVTVNSATIDELAQVMKHLGAVDAMNLDGGASSGLYYDGKYMTAPGRDLSNAIIIYSK